MHTPPDSSLDQEDGVTTETLANLSALPAVNAALNGASAILVASARGFIRRGQVATHRALMLAAVATSSVFLVSYLYYHAHVGSVHFQGHGWSRPVYFTILTTHTILAAAIVPLVLVTLTLGLRRRDRRHRAIARWTYPIWLYVSITGVVIYFMLYHLFRA
jgi:uncharacterized membrane protein YozB (DUF420 family)